MRSLLTADLLRFMLHKIKIALLIFTIVALVILGLLNRKQTAVDLVFTRLDVPTTLLVFLSALLGFLAGVLAPVLWKHRRSLKAK